MYKLDSLRDIPFDDLFKSFKNAFSDYEMQLEKDELERMLVRRGFVPELSFGAFDRDKLVAFTFNGIGNFNGVKTAYDTGTGTMKEYRKKGLATKIFEYSIPFLKKAGIKQYLLEVLQHNTKAVSIYKKLGFGVTREFNYYVQDNKDFKVKFNDSIKIKSIEPDKLEDYKSFFDFSPSWQNSFESIKRNIKEFKAIAAFLDNKVAGFCVMEPKSGDITLIAVDKDKRRKGIGTNLLAEIMKINQFNSIKCINTDIRCNAISKFMESNSIELSGKQFEMIKQL